jgi:hypothetical protein
MKAHPLRCASSVRTRFLSLVIALLAWLVAFGCDEAQLMVPSDDVDAGASSYDAGRGLESGGLPDPFEGDDASDDGAIALPIWNGGDDDDASSPGATGPPFDAGPDGECDEPMGTGDLAIVEILIASESGTGDHGEWLEVRSARDCALDLRGLHGECAVGAKVATVDVTTDVWLAARGSFVIADSTDPAVNHALPGLVVAWSGDPGDVLRNQGTTVTLLANGVLVDSVTYPPLKIPLGTSLSFPSDCASGVRGDWSRWQSSSASWFPGFHGTPNGPNDDVRCPDD